MDAIQQLGYLAGGSRFRRIYEKLQISGDKIYEQAGLDFKSSWFPVFYTLAAAGEPLTIMSITDRIAFSHITVKNIVQELAAHDLVIIKPNPADKRSKLVSLSRKGTGLLKKLQPLWAAISRTLETILTNGHPAILAILARIDEQLSAQPLHERIRHT